MNYARTIGTVSQLIEDTTGRPFYADSEKHNNQFVGRVAIPRSKFEALLRDLGFERNPLPRVKHFYADTEKYKESSFRQTPAPDMQLHTILYAGSKIGGEPDHTYVYAHWEYRWDTNPWAHFRRYDYNGPEGVKRMKEILDREAVAYKAVRP